VDYNICTIEKWRALSQENMLNVCFKEKNSGFEPCDTQPCRRSDVYRFGAEMIHYYFKRRISLKI